MLRLEAGLKRLPMSERNDIISDFEEYFASGLEAGLTEEEISRKLGEPGLIVKELIAEYRIVAAERTKSFSGMLRAVSATMGIGLKALIGLIPVLAAICGFLFIGILPVMLLIAPLTLLATMPFYDRTDLMLYIFLSITFFSLGILGAAGLYLTGKRLSKWALTSTKIQLKLVKGGAPI